MKTKNIITIIGLIGMLAITALATTCNRNLKAENRRLKTNITALADSVRVTKTKNGELEYNRKTLITTIGELSQLNQKLHKEAKKTKGKVVYIQGTKVIIRDTIEVPLIITPTDSGQIIDANIDTLYSPGNYRIVKHQIRMLPGDTSSTFAEEIGLSVTTGLKKNEKGDYEILFRTDFPGVRSVALAGAYIPRNQIKGDFKPRRLSVGLQVGYSPLAYDFTERMAKFRNQITAGIGLNYKL